MTAAWLDSSDGEDYGEGEEYGEAGEFVEATDAERRRRARLAQARRRQAQSRTRIGAGRPVSAPTGQQRAISAIRDLDLETSVADDALNARISKLVKNGDRAAYAAAATAVLEQLFASGLLPDSPALQAVGRGGPLLLLAASGRRHGVEAVLNPAPLGILSIAAISLFSELRGRANAVQRIELQANPTVNLHATELVLASVVDQRGIRLDSAVTWTTDGFGEGGNASIASLTGNRAAITGTATGSVIVAAAVDGVVASTLVTVIDH